MCNNKEKELLRRELAWLGYGALTPGTLGHPSADRQPLDETLLEMKLTDKVVVFIANTEDIASREVLRELSHDCWNMSGIEKKYNHFIERFSPVYRAVNRAKKTDPEQCFQVRTLLIHEYRRIQLQDSDLPGELLPPNWPGIAAYNLTKNIYRAVQKASVDYLMKNMESIEGSLSEPVKGFYTRFNGAGV